MHRRIRRRILARCASLLAVAGLAACATTAPSRPETPAIRELRADYLRAFPEGRFNDHIQRGEVVKGMSLYEVLASWGIPDAREVATQDNRERWVYVVVDDASLDWIRYDYLFNGNVLLDWEVTRNVANGLSLDTPEHRPSAVSLPSWASTTRPGGAPIR